MDETSWISEVRANLTTCLSLTKFVKNAEGDERACIVTIRTYSRAYEFLSGFQPGISIISDVSITGTVIFFSLKKIGVIETSLINTNNTWLKTREKFILSIHQERPLTLIFTSDLTVKVVQSE